eukprot:9094440-Pyramimonas_sp.AAC.1
MGCGIAKLSYKKRGRPRDRFRVQSRRTNRDGAIELPVQDHCDRRTLGQLEARESIRVVVDHPYYKVLFLLYREQLIGGIRQEFAMPMIRNQCRGREG